MKKILLVPRLLLCLLFISIYTQAQTVVRVTVGMDLQTEITNAAPGTVFLVEHTSGNSITINKQVYIIGTGYKLGQPRTEVNQISFVAGSDNSVVTGMTVSNSIFVTADNITIRRNLIYGSVALGYNTNGTPTKISNCLISQNYIEENIDFVNNSNSKPANTLIKNNIIVDDIEVCDACTGTATNNTILNEGNCNQGFGSGYEMTFFNNIIYSDCNYTSRPNGNYSTNSTFVHNIIRDTHYITSDPSNKKLTNFSNEFTGYPNFAGTLLDARFQLKSTSAAKGAGLGGVDCGAFGGPDPYVLDGIPEGPNIISVNAPSGAAAGQTITVNIQAVNQN